MTIYYFSGSGNSLYVAREISRNVGATITHIATLDNGEDITIADDSIGIVFPVYFAAVGNGIPLIVQRFLSRISSLDRKYIFAVCTSEHTPGDTISNVDTIISTKRGKLSAGWIINTSTATLADAIKAKLGGAKVADISVSPDIDSGIQQISSAILHKETHKIHTRSLVKKVLSIPMIPIMNYAFSKRYQKLTGTKQSSFMDYVPYVDNSFCVNDQCTSCGICTKVCPMDNISLEDSQPKWHNKCENCLACYQYCPSNAICGKTVEYNNRYHHPDISAKDMMDPR